MTKSKRPRTWVIIPRRPIEGLGCLGKLSSREFADIQKVREKNWSGAVRRGEVAGGRAEGMSGEGAPYQGVGCENPRSLTSSED